MWKRYNGAAFCMVILLFCAAGGSAMAKEAGTEYDFGPVSYDLTNLPPMENEQYAVWKGCTYYRQYSDEDMDEWYWGYYFPPEADTKKELMRMNAGGSVEQVGVDYGWDKMYIMKGRIYSDKFVKHGEKTDQIVYSCALDGSDAREYGPGGILGVHDDRVICDLDGSKLFWIDGKDGKQHVLVPLNKSEYLLYQEATDSGVFFSRSLWNKEKQKTELHLCFVDYQGKACDLRTFTEQEYVDYINSFVGEYWDWVMPSTSLLIDSFQVWGDDLYFLVGMEGGTAHVYPGGMIVHMKTDGSGYEVLGASDSPYFYLYDDGINRSLYYSPCGGDGEAAVAKRIVLKGKAPSGVTLRPKEAGEWGCWDYDVPQVCPTADGRESVLFYPDTSGICYVLLSAEEMEELGIAAAGEDDGGEQRKKIDHIEYLEGRLFFTVTELNHREELDSSRWGNGYERGKSVCYCKDLESGEIRALYEY